jgi:hypothetical protein
MYVHLRGLGGPPTNKQFYLNSLEASYKKHLASGECPFNALFLAGNDVMTGSEQNPDAMAAMDEFSAAHAQEAMTVPCGSKTDTTAAPVKPSAPPAEKDPFHSGWIQEIVDEVATPIVEVHPRPFSVSSSNSSRSVSYPAGPAPARVVPTPTRAPDPPGSNTGMWFVAGTVVAIGIGYLIYRSQSVGEL